LPLNGIGMGPVMPVTDARPVTADLTREQA
jgi:hypothetical protein